MKVSMDREITGEVARDLRASTRLLQREFWGAVGVTQESGCRYELNKSPIPRPVRILLFLVYAAGLDIDTSTPEGAERLARLAELQHDARTKNVTAVTQDNQPE
jgi:hypothetical protein